MDAAATALEALLGADVEFRSAGIAVAPDNAPAIYAKVRTAILAGFDSSSLTRAFRPLE